MTGGRGRRVSVLSRQNSLRAPARAVAAAARAAAEHARTSGSRLSIVIVGDAEMRELNARFSRAAGTTDVLAFDLSDDGETGDEGPAGEVIVNADVAIAEAAKRGKGALGELLLYVVHGVLHLGGYRDHSAAERRRMRRAEGEVMTKLRKTLGDLLA